MVALPLITAELHDFTDSDWTDLQARGLRVIHLVSSQVQKAFALKGQFPGLSAYDRFSLALMKPTAHAMLFTGDQQLRLCASALGVEVHGMLRLCDHIERMGGLALDDLADALDRLLADPLVFLPVDEVKARIARMREGRGSR